MEIWKEHHKIGFYLEKNLVGAFAVQELCKLTGKHKLFPQTNYLKTKINHNDLEKILEKNLFIIGCGGKCHEIIRVLAALCDIFQKNMIVYVLDEAKIQEASLPHSLFFK